MLRHVVIAAAVLLPLSACGSRASEEPAATTNNSGDYIAKVEQLNEKERNAVLFRALSDAGRPCQGVKRSVATQAVGGRPAWVATCEDGRPWVVTLDNNGMATVVTVAPNSGG